MKFDAFTFRKFFQFERITINLITHNEMMLSKIKRTIQRENSISEKKRKKKFKTRNKKKNVIEKIIKTIKYRKFKMIK